MNIDLTNDEIVTVMNALECILFENSYSNETKEKAFALREKILCLIQYDMFKKVVLGDGLLKGMKLNA